MKRDNSPKIKYYAKIFPFGESRAGEVIVAWSIQLDLQDSELVKLLFSDLLENSTTRCLPDLENIHKELAKSGAKLRLL